MSYHHLRKHPFRHPKNKKRIARGSNWKSVTEALLPIPEHTHVPNMASFWQTMLCQMSFPTLCTLKAIELRTKSFEFRKISIIYQNLQKNKTYLIKISNMEYFKYLNKPF